MELTGITVLNQEVKIAAKLMNRKSFRPDNIKAQILDKGGTTWFPDIFNKINNTRIIPEKRVQLEFKIPKVKQFE